MVKKLLPRTVRRQLKFAVNRVRYLGTGRTCPVCNGHSRSFATFGYIPRLDAECVWCGSLERHRLVWLYFERQLGLRKHSNQATFLHVAPEPCLEPRLRRAFPGRYLTADLFADHVDVKMDICQIGFPDRSFELIYCSHVLEHVPDDIQAMREFRRVLTDNGTAVIMVPIDVPKTIEDPSITDPEERFRVFGQRDHVRSYGPDFGDRLVAAGFKVTRILPQDFLTPLEITEMGIHPSAGDVIFSCRKG